MSVAKSYASALFLAAQAEKLEAPTIAKMEADLKGFASELVKNRELRAALVGPATTTSEKHAIVKAFEDKLAWHPSLRNFLNLAMRKGRFDSLPEIAQAFAQVRVESSGGVLGLLESADPLSDSDVQQLSEAFTKKLGKRVEFQCQSQPGLLAGVRVTVAGTTYDGTLKAQLNRLRDKFLETSTSTH